MRKNKAWNKGDEVEIEREEVKGMDKERDNREGEEHIPSQAAYQDKVKSTGNTKEIKRQKLN